MNNQFLNLKSKYHNGSLNNNMKYIYSINNNLKYVSLIIYIRVGSKYENKQEKGLAHFLEHMLFKSTKKYNTNIKINTRIDELSASINASTTYNYTNYYITLPSKFIKEGLELLNEMIFNPIFYNKEIEKEKNVVIEEINSTIDNSIEYCSDLIISELYNKYDITKEILGSKKNIKNINKKTLLNFYKKYYLYSNSCISLCGDLPKNIKSLLNKVFFKQDIINKTIFGIEEINLNLPKPKILCKFRKREQIIVGLGFPIFNLYDKRKNELDILTNLLYGNMTSRLWLVLREINPIVYGLNVYYQLLEELGIFVIKMSFEKNKLEESIKFLFKELKKLKNNLFPKKDFDRLKNIQLNDNIINNNDFLDIAEFYGEQFILDEKIETYNSLNNIYKKINEQDINRLCNEIFNFNNCILLQIGDINKSNIEKLFYKYVN